LLKEGKSTLIKMLKRTFYTMFALPMSAVFYKAFWWQR